MYGKKTLILIFCLMLILVVAAACSTNESNPKSDKANDTGTETETETETDAETEENKHISVITTHNGTPYGAKVENWENDKYLKELERLTGYDLEYDVLGHGADYKQQLTIRFVSGDLADMVRTTSISDGAHPDAVEQGAFHKLNDLLEEHGSNILAGIPEDVWKNPKISKDGDIYAIPVIFGADAMRVMYYRQDYLDKLNMDTPKTLDEYMEFCEAVKTTDLNENGQQDEYCYYGRENMKYSELFFGAHGIFPSTSTWQYRDGQFVPDAILPEMKEPLKMWRDFYENGYINPTFFTTSNNDWKAGIYRGEAATWTHDVNSYNGLWAESFFDDPSAKIALELPPEGPAGAKLFPRKDLIWQIWVIPKSVEDPERVIKFLDLAWEDEQVDQFFHFGIEGFNYTMENGELQFDIEQPNNAQDSQFLAFRNVLSLTKGTNTFPEILQAYDEDMQAFMKDGYEKADQAGIAGKALNMPTLEIFKKRPEIVPAINPGTLFLDMLAKVLTGEEDVDQSFDNFVEEWKKRGGNEAITEATEWYHQYYEE